MIEKVFRFFNKNKLYHSLLFIVLIITSCDDKIVSLNEDSSITTNYIQRTFILDADKSKQVVVIKRSMSPGYAGIANPLFVNENTKMLFSDAKDGLNQILNSFSQV